MTEPVIERVTIDTLPDGRRVRCSWVAGGEDPFLVEEISDVVEPRTDAIELVRRDPHEPMNPWPQVHDAAEYVPAPDLGPGFRRHRHTREAAYSSAWLNDPRAVPSD